VSLKSVIRRALPKYLASRGALVAKLANYTNLSRGPLCHLYLKGSGIEVGALNGPLEVPPGVTVAYVDFQSQEDLKKRYPQHADKILPVDFQTTIEKLDGIANDSQDFVIANHVLEHSEDPIAAFQSVFRVLKPGGIFFLALPDKRFTFDRARPVTPFEHLVKDHEEGPEGSRMEHFRESARAHNGLTDPGEIDDLVNERMSLGHKIHFHVWEQLDILEMFVRLRREFSVPIEVEATSKSGIELIAVLSKRP
jgi:SAM-dependent methyltransferase